LAIPEFGGTDLRHVSRDEISGGAKTVAVVGSIAFKKIMRFSAATLWRSDAAAGAVHSIIRGCDGANSLGLCFSSEGSHDLRACGPRSRIAWYRGSHYPSAIMW
jgi:hypothetical protein